MVLETRGWNVASLNLRPYGCVSMQRLSELRDYRKLLIFFSKSYCSKGFMSLNVDEMIGQTKNKTLPLSSFDTFFIPLSNYNGFLSFFNVTCAKVGQKSQQTFFSHFRTSIVVLLFQAIRVYIQTF